ncbi:MAG: DUF883 C-terminal domain-containing protein [Verrucomicrobiota bacterium]
MNNESITEKEKVDLEETKIHAENTAEELKRLASEKGEEWLNLAREKGSEFSAAAKENFSETKEKLEDWKVEGEEYVRENPGKSLLAALGIGVLVGMIIKKAQ